MPGKNSITKLTGATLLCAVTVVPGMVHAQSSVSIYGIISTGIQYVNDAGAGEGRLSLANGGMMPPRIGFKGNEDLGGGNHAIFTLENGFNIKNGAMMNGGLFGRQAFVGLKNDRYGTVTLGRQYEEMTCQLWWSESSSLFSGIGAHIGDNDNMFLTNRFNNSIRYASPEIGGFTLAANYAFSDSTGTSNNNAYSIGGNYVQGRLKLGAAFSQFNRRSDAVPPNTTTGAIDNSGWGFSSPFVTSLGGAGTDKQRIAGVGAAYDFGFMNLNANYTNVRFNYSDASDLRLQNAELGASTRITPAWLVGVAYVYTWGEYSSAAEPNWHQLNLGTLYSLSKRTDLFLTAISQRAGGDARFAQVYTNPRSSGSSQNVITAGIRHRF